MSSIECTLPALVMHNEGSSFLTTSTNDQKWNPLHGCVSLPRQLPYLPANQNMTQDSLNLRKISRQLSKLIEEGVYARPTWQKLQHGHGKTMNHIHSCSNLNRCITLMLTMRVFFPSISIIPWAPMSISLCVQRP